MNKTLHLHFCVFSLAMAAAASPVWGQAVTVQKPPLTEIFPGLGESPGISRSNAVSGRPVQPFPPLWPGENFAGALTATLPGEAIDSAMNAAMQRMLRLMMVAMLDEELEPGFVRSISENLIDLDGRVEWDQIRRLAGGNSPALERLIELDAMLGARNATAGPRPAAAENSLALTYVQFLEERLRHEMEMLRETGRVVRITNWISWFIFVVAHAILAIGLWAAVREFLHAAATRQEAPPAPRALVTGMKETAHKEASEPGAAQLALAQNEIRVSLEGIALKTTLHGILLFVLAIGFYVLYLKFVYPVTLVGE